MKTPKFAKESDLCAAFIAAVDARKWTVYPESGGWDVLLVRKSDGAQVGIEAKLKLNPLVVCQALPSKFHDHIGPDYRAVLVPSGEATPPLAEICGHLGITVIICRGEDGARNGRRKFSPDLPSEASDPEYDWHQQAPLHRHDLPEYVPDCPAGTPAPIALTHWKIQAIKLAVVLEDRPLTRADFKAAKVSIYRWIDPFSGWLVSSERGQYVRGPRFPDFAAQHPKNFAEIRADKANWIWPSPKQGALV